MTWPSNSAQNSTDAEAGIDVTDAFEPFSQRNDVFTRAIWDEKVRTPATKKFFASYRIESAPRRGDGFTQKDFALRNASWLISDLISNRSASDGLREGFQGAIQNDTPVSMDQIEVEDSTAMSAEIKKIASFFGADLCGITDLDRRWIYSHRADARDGSETGNELPDGVNSVIVLGHQMDVDLVDTYPSALAGAATGREYSHEAAVVMQLAAYIRNLGYEAVASMNDTGLVIPYALKAGLGEYARNQLVIPRALNFDTGGFPTRLFYDSLVAKENFLWLRRLNYVLIIMPPGFARLCCGVRIPVKSADFWPSRVSMTG